MKIENIISATKNRLTWTIEHDLAGGRNLEITSDPWARIHTIHMPTQGTDFREIEYLHEMAHAVLAEKHHLLSTAWFMRGTPEAAYRKMTEPIRSASDWFADDLLMQWAPDEERAEIREHIGYAAKVVRLDNEIMYSGALFYAQGVKYCGNKRQDIPRRYRKPADILLAVDPGKPSVETKRGLVNNLAALTCNLRLILAVDDALEVWKIKDLKMRGIG